MRYFLDTEFIEQPGSIQLISIGIVSECDHTFYAENTSFDERMADDWVKENVLAKLLFVNEYGGSHTPPVPNADVTVVGNQTLIKNELLEYFCDDGEPIFYGYFADYDWVIFCWIFGKMIHLPAGFPKYCRDLKQMLDESGKMKIPSPGGEHNALVDALWNKELYEHLTG